MPKKKKLNRIEIYDGRAIGEYRGLKWINPKTGKALTKKERQNFYAKV